MNVLYLQTNFLNFNVDYFSGLRSYGKVVYVFGIFPILGFLVFATKIIGLLPMATFKYWFMNTQWLEFVYNGQVNIFLTPICVRSSLMQERTTNQK
jgi:hypothetical protein